MERGHPCPHSVRSTLITVDLQRLREFALRAQADRDVRAPANPYLRYTDRGYTVIPLRANFIRSSKSLRASARKNLIPLIIKSTQTSVETCARKKLGPSLDSITPMLCAYGSTIYVWPA